MTPKATKKKTANPKPWHTDNTDTTETGESLSDSRPVTVGAAGICMGLAFLLMGNAFLERGIELIASADARS